MSQANSTSGDSGCFEFREFEFRYCFARLPQAGISIFDIRVFHTFIFDCSSDALYI